MNAHANIPCADLLAEIQAFCARKGIAKSDFGGRALGDPSFVTDLENGREPRRRTVNRVLDFMAREPAAPQTERAAG